MIEALLVANRGEIAIRAFRAANELGVRSIAVYVPEDRDSVHRLKADESYQIGEAGHPVSTYLDTQLIVDLAVAVGADAIYPGYGFMAENPVLARCCEAAGVRFVGPPAEVLGLAGDKTRAREIASRAGVAVLEASAGIPSRSFVPSGKSTTGRLAASGPRASRSRFVSGSLAESST